MLIALLNDSRITAAAAQRGGEFRCPSCNKALVLKKGRIVILAGGTGNPFVTTDTAAALRGRELAADVLLKATRVDGVYNADPEQNPHAVRYDKLTYTQVIRDNLRVMDITAMDMCREGKLPILVFNFKREGNIERAIAGQPIGTYVTE